MAMAHLREVSVKVVRGMKMEGSRHQARRQHRLVQAERVVGWTEILGTKEEKEDSPEKRLVTQMKVGGRKQTLRNQ